MTNEESKSDVQPHQERIATLAKLEDEKRKGVNWFFWISALSLVNFIILQAGSNRSFLIGLGITQLIAIGGNIPRALLRTPILGQIILLIRRASFFLELPLHKLGFNPPMIELVFAVLIAFVFVLFGVMGLKNSRLAVALGMTLYALDSLIFIFYEDYFSLVFHLVVFVALANGLRALNSIKKLQSSN